MSQETALRLKRTIDILVSAIVLVLLAPIMAFVALIIRLTIGPPVIFRQPRIGYLGRAFTLYKFRTMTNSQDDRGNLLPDEQRLTSLGRLLRSLTLDELPELMNVLRGEMSLVGPRPLRVEYRNVYTPEQWHRHEMPPGMAGPVLASGRNILSWEQKFVLDVWYVDNWSLGLDVKIVIMTALKVLSRKGVSAEGHATMPWFEGTKAERHNKKEPS